MTMLASLEQRNLLAALQNKQDSRYFHTICYFQHLYHAQQIQQPIPKLQILTFHYLSNQIDLVKKFFKNRICNFKIGCSLLDPVSSTLFFY
jgi:hypothetical protein